MIDELARNGDRLSSDTLYPTLSKMERDGHLSGKTEREGRMSREFYMITEQGREGLAVAQDRLREPRGEAGKE